MSLTGSAHVSILHSVVKFCDVYIAARVGLRLCLRGGRRRAAAPWRVARRGPGRLSRAGLTSRADERCSRGGSFRRYRCKQKTRSQNASWRSLVGSEVRITGGGAGRGTATAPHAAAPRAPPVAVPAPRPVSGRAARARTPGFRRGRGAGAAAPGRPRGAAARCRDFFLAAVLCDSARLGAVQSVEFYPRRHATPTARPHDTVRPLHTFVLGYILYTLLTLDLNAPCSSYTLSEALCSIRTDYRIMPLSLRLYTTQSGVNQARHKAVSGTQLLRRKALVQWLLECGIWHVCLSGANR